MGTTVERLPGQGSVALQIEVDQERVDKHMDRAVSRISKQVRIPGFRPGKAPRKTVERHVGSAAILQEALEELVPEVYNEALQEHAIDAIDQPDFDLKSTEPLVVVATVPVRPDVDLGDYQSLRAPKPEVGVTDEQMEETLVNLRRQFAVLEPVERAVEWDDHIRADVSVQVEGESETHSDEDAEFAVREGTVVSLPGFVERLVGLEAGGPHTIEFSLPDDFPSGELAGKKATYTVTIHEVKREILPDLDDEFVASLDEEGVTTVAELQERVRSDLQTAQERNATETYHNEIIDLLMATATLDYPSVLVQREVERLIDRESNHAAHTQEGLQNWLNTIGKTLDEVQEMFREQADLNVRRALVLGELVDAESIQVSDEAIEEEIGSLISQMTGGNTQNQEAIRGLIDTPDGRTSIRNQLMTRFAVERLEEICSQPEEAGEASAPRASRRRRARAEGDAEGDEAVDETAGEGTQEE